jgi:hypothetical protein
VAFLSEYAAVNGVGTKLDTKLTLINNSKGLVLSATIAGFCSVADASGGRWFQNPSLIHSKS